MLVIISGASIAVADLPRPAPLGSAGEALYRGKALTGVAQQVDRHIQHTSIKRGRSGVLPGRTVGGADSQLEHFGVV